VRGRFLSAVIILDHMKGLMIAGGILCIIFGFLMLLGTGAFSTRYAPGYSEGAFKRIHVGMGTNEVLQVAGKPLHQGYNSPDRSWYWRYTDCDDSFSTYKMRMLRITNNGVVAEIFRCYATD
jgi:hypothetical protein